VRSQGTVEPGGDEMPTWLLVLIIVLIVLALFGGFGYRRR
jgi:LPXTG-motif cell wall-anchored protein